MNAQKLAYWLSLAVFALALQSSYQRGAFPSIHRAAEHAASGFCRVTAAAEQAYVLVRALATRDSFYADVDSEEAADLVQAQTEILRAGTWDRAELLRDQLRAQAGVRRAEFQMRRDQIQQLRDLASVQVHNGQLAARQIMVVVPKSCVRSRLQISTAPDPPDAAIVFDDDSDSF